MQNEALAIENQSVSFSNSFLTLEDPRRTTNGNFIYSLDEILFLVISAVISGSNTWVAIENFGQSKLGWLKRFLKYENGTPSHDVLGDVFGKLDIDKFNECFINWVSVISSLTSGEVVGIDGKTVCGSGSNKKKAVHIISAFAAKNQLCLGQLATDEKSNEITAIPKLLELIAIKGCTVTIDAMGCQKKIAKQIRNSEADYILMVKDNQKGLKEQIENEFDRNQSTQKNEAVDCGHGRVETRICEVIDDLTFLDVKPDWKDLKSIIKITSLRHIKTTGESSREIRYYISSLLSSPSIINESIRSHWAVENNLHWSLDVVFKEDNSLKKQGNSAFNFNIISKIALGLLKSESSYKASIPQKRYRATLDDKYREKVLKV